MTRDEFGVLVKAMKAVYADPKFIADKDAFDVWYGLLKDLDYKPASMALQRFMQSSKWPPTVADIREQYKKVTEPAPMSEAEAWILVHKALSDSGYHSQERFDELPNLIQKAVGSPGQLKRMALDEHFNEGVEESNFLRKYRNVCEIAEREAMLPEGVRQRDNEITKNGEVVPA